MTTNTERVYTSPNGAGFICPGRPVLTHSGVTVPSFDLFGANGEKIGYSVGRIGSSMGLSCGISALETLHRLSQAA